jgi:uncharacterized lipoprotein YmbA
MRATALTWIVCVITAFLTACATSPATRFYTLTATAAPAATPSALVVAVGPVTVPATVDRPEIVVSAGRNELIPADFHRWASPLQDNFSRVIAEDLGLILGSPRVGRFPPALGVDVDYRVLVDVRSFNSTLGEAAAIDAMWTVRRMKDKKTQSGTTVARESTADGSYQALAAAHSQAAAKMSRDIAAAIAALQREAP